MKTGDASYIKKLNRKILLEEIIKNKALSRSDLARITGLNKATVSVQVNNLLNEHIVKELSETEAPARGRRPILIEINASAGFSIGIDIDNDSINIIFINLKGELFHKLVLPVDQYDMKQITEQLIQKISPLIKKFKEKYQPVGLVGIGTGIHGIVNNNDEIVFTPKQHWSNLYISDKLENAFQTDIFIDNNANLSVLAEQVYGEYMPDLFCVTLHSGIGLGIMNENKIYRGFEGFAGEIGHMIIQANGLPCPCGNKGCWEQYASETALLKKLREKNIFIPQNLEEIRNIPDGEEIVDNYLDYLAIGINNIINIFNPEKLVLNGSLINSSAPFTEELSSRLLSKINSYRKLKVSSLGKDACALGGASLALKNYFEVDVLTFPDSIQ